MNLAQLFAALAARHYTVNTVNGLWFGPLPTNQATVPGAVHRLMKSGPVFVDVLIPEGDESQGVTERLWIRDGQVTAPRGSALHGVLAEF